MKREIWNLKGNCNKKTEQVIKPESLSFWELESFKEEGRTKKRGSEDKEDKLFHGHSQ